MHKSSFANHGNYAPGKRDVKQVPFVELFDGRLQGAVSSGSDIQRVYVSFFEAQTLDYYCSTNNNRPCGGLRGYPCKHLIALLTEAIAAYGVDEVSNYLKLSASAGHVKSINDILSRKGCEKKVQKSEVFSRFLNYLRYLELKRANIPLPEMAWFVD